jgi:glycosyltransferase involved in cell wall biosynthesis
MDFLKTIAYDANFAIGEYRGMGVFLNLFVEVIGTEFAHTFQLVPMASKKFNSVASNVQTFGSNNYILWEQFSFPKRLRRLNPYACIFPYNTMPYKLQLSATKKILFVHDLIFLHHIHGRLTLRQQIGKWYRKNLIIRSLQNCDVVVTVSNTSQQEIEQILPSPKDIHVIPNAVNVATYSQKIGQLNNQYREPFILHIGGDAPHKNTSNAIKALEILHQKYNKPLSLIILGVHSKKNRKNFLKFISRKSSVIFLDFIQEKEKIFLLQHAQLLLFCSLVEGFGIPLTEAMAANCCIAASNTSCMPEIAGEAAIYFNPYNVNDMAEKMNELLENKNLQETLIEKGKQQVKQYDKAFVRKKIQEFLQKTLC